MHWARCEKDTRWKFAIRPTRKQLRAADPFIWYAAMKCALEQLSGPPSNLDTILSLPLLPQIARSCLFAPTKQISRGDVPIFYHLHRTALVANAKVHNHYRNL